MSADRAVGELLGAQSPAERGRAALRLGAVLRLHPESVTEATRALTGASSLGVAGLLLRGIAASGSANAAHALVSIVESPSQSPELRAAACGALTDPALSPALTVPALLAARSIPGLGSAATLALGTTLRTHAEASPEPRAALATLTHEYLAAPVAQRGLLLAALGNAGAPALAAETAELPHLPEDDRAKLVWALRYVQAAPVERAVRSALADSAISVRGAALRVCSLWADLSRCPEWASVALGDTDAHVRRRALQLGITNSRTDAERSRAHEVAERMARTDGDTTNRAAARGALAALARAHTSSAAEPDTDFANQEGVSP